MDESHSHKRLVTVAVDVIAGNSDLLTEILLRLPARSLIRFTVVCKHWCTLIFNTQFRLRHFGTLAYPSSVPSSGLYFYNCLTACEKVESRPLAHNVTKLPPLLLFGVMDANIEVANGIHMRVTQSCNGLLLCVVSPKPQDDLKLGLVYNPATREVYQFPDPYNGNYHGAVYYNLIFDPSEPPYFKVLCVKHLCKYSRNFDVSVYVPGSESWRSCCRLSLPSNMYLESGVLWNGGIHWIGEHYSVFFDANSEQVAIKEKPPRPQGDCRQTIRYFGESGGHLHLIQVQSVYAIKFSVLELNKDTWKWSVKYRVHLARLISAFPEMVQVRSSGTQYVFSILSVFRGENEEDSVLLLTVPGKVVAYNLVLKTAKVACELPGEIDQALHLKPISAFQYTESLAPIQMWNVIPS